MCGDALCAFNPIYGQGMTVAAAEAIALRDCLAHGERDLARRFFAAARPAVDHAWRLATGADLALPDVPGSRPLGVRVINAYLRRLRAVAEHDPAVAGAFIAVVGMREPPGHVLRPATALRVLRGPRPNGWREPVAAVRHGELRVGEITTPLREAGPAGADEAVVFVHGNPGSSADWEPLMAAIGAHRRAVAWDAPGFGRARAPAGFAADRERPRGVHQRQRSEPWASSARTWCCTTSAGRGACAGRPATRHASPRRCCWEPA